MTELSMWDYEGRIQEALTRGEIAVCGTLCPDCYGLVPRISDGYDYRPDARTKTIATVRMCACGLTTTGDADRAVHGGITAFSPRTNRVRE